MLLIKQYIFILKEYEWLHNSVSEFKVSSYPFDDSNSSSWGTYQFLIYLYIYFNLLPTWGLTFNHDQVFVKVVCQVPKEELKDESFESTKP